jgi:hypothetical protein
VEEKKKKGKTSQGAGGEKRNVGLFIKTTKLERQFWHDQAKQKVGRPLAEIVRGDLIGRFGQPETEDKS